MHTTSPFKTTLIFKSYQNPFRMLLLRCNPHPLKATAQLPRMSPKTFPQAQRDPVWGEPARLEFDATKSLVRMDTSVARHHIQQGAEVLYMIPVYEEKMKEGKLVRKVRLVVNGKHYNKHGSTYARPLAARNFSSSCIFSQPLTATSITSMRTELFSTQGTPVGTMFLIKRC